MMKNLLKKRKLAQVQQPQEAAQAKKEKIRVDLLVKAREVLQDKGLEYLTARKLADYSGYSVGTIYNQFKSMDAVIGGENC